MKQKDIWAKESLDKTHGPQTDMTLFLSVRKESWMAGFEYAKEQAKIALHSQEYAYDIISDLGEEDIEDATKP